MRIITLLDTTEADTLLARLGFSFYGPEVVVPRRPPEAHRHRALRMLSAMVAETIVRSSEIGRVDVVVGTGFSTVGLTAALTANLAHDIQRCQGGGAHIPNVMLCRDGTSEDRRGRLTPYGDDGEQMDSTAIRRAICGRRMLFVCLSAEEGTLVFHAMRTAVHEKNQGGANFSATHNLLAGIVALVMRDEESSLQRYYERIVGITPPIMTLKALGLPARVRPLGKSGVHPVFKEQPK